MPLDAVAERLKRVPVAPISRFKTKRLKSQAGSGWRTGAGWVRRRRWRGKSPDYDAGDVPETNDINVLLIGGGGREHALATKLQGSARLGELWTTHPGNPGLASLARAVDVPVDIRQAYRLEQFTRHKDIGLVLIGPEEPLADGWADRLTTDRTKVFGPTKAAAQLEGDKAWAKKLMRGALVPTAEGRVFREVQAARSYLAARDEALVVKAAGLAKGKGVIICETQAQASDAVERIMVRREFGAAGDVIVIEERLEGPEVSVFALVDGRNFLILDACQDHKRLGEGDTGPNTGGMGAYCPTPLVDAELMGVIQKKILVPTIDAMRREGIEYRGVLYAGLMLTPSGPKVLEFNVRFGDPECQCLVPRLRGDLLEILLATATGKLEEIDLDWDPRPTCCIVLASAGYPDQPRTGDVITGIEHAEERDGIFIYHAGIARNDAGDFVTAGGRVLSVVGQADTLEEARTRALEACDRIHFDGKHLRRDIAWQAIVAAASPS